MLTGFLTISGGVLNYDTVTKILEMNFKKNIKLHRITPLTDSNATVIYKFNCNFVQELLLRPKFKKLIKSLQDNGIDVDLLEL